MSLRVVAGSACGRILAAPPGRTTRPTSDRVREAIFNALHSLGAVEGAEVLDAFAGTGSLGIEALSRGASSVVFAEPDRAARAAIAGNLERVLAGGHADGVAAVRPSTAERLLAELQGSGRRFDLVLLDPPYGFDAWPGLLEAVAGVLREDAVVVVESDRPVAVGPNLEITRAKRYGGTVVTFARPSGAES